MSLKTLCVYEERFQQSIFITGGAIVILKEVMKDMLLVHMCECCKE